MTSVCVVPVVPKVLTDYLPYCCTNNIIVMEWIVRAVGPKLTKFPADDVDRLHRKLGH